MLGKDVRTGEIRPVMDGAEVFKLMDSIGLPLDIIRDLLEENKMAFDVRGFIIAARNSKNFTQERLTMLLTRDVANDEELIEKVKITVEFLYRKDEKGKQYINN